MVRKNAVRVLPKINTSAELLLKCLENDKNTLRHILLTLSIMPKNDDFGEIIYGLKTRLKNERFKHLIILL